MAPRVDFRAGKLGFRVLDAPEFAREPWASELLTLSTSTKEVTRTKGHVVCMPHESLRGGGRLKQALNNWEVETFSKNPPRLEQALQNITQRIRRGPGLCDGSGNACACRNYGLGFTRFLSKFGLPCSANGPQPKIINTKTYQNPDPKLETLSPKQQKLINIGALMIRLEFWGP